MMRCLKSASLIAFLALVACNGNPYRRLTAQKPSVNSALNFKPVISREMFRCVVDGRFLFKRFHLSGILLFKQFEDGSTRAVFQNELGIAFFDFKWNKQDSFSVVRIMQQLDKPAVIKTLGTDLRLLLMKGFSKKDEAMLISGADTVSRFPVNTGYAYYLHSRGRITDIEYAGRSRITSVHLAGEVTSPALSSSIIFTHHKAHFTIVLRKLSQDDQ